MTPGFDRPLVSEEEYLPCQYDSEECVGQITADALCDVHRRTTPGAGMNTDQIPGWEGSQGPFRGQYSQPHVYARDIHSGAGNCVCGSDLGDHLHVQAAPGVDVPKRMRR